MPVLLYGSGIRRDLIEKPEHFRRGHATVWGSEFAEKRDAFALFDRATEAYALGRRKNVMNLSQENCPADSHRLTHERWGGDLRRAQPARSEHMPEIL